jgi:hypothetical protein
VSVLSQPMVLLPALAWVGRVVLISAVSICSAKPDGGVRPPGLDSRRDHRDRPRPR